MPNKEHDALLPLRFAAIVVFIGGGAIAIVKSIASAGAGMLVGGILFLGLGISLFFFSPR